MHCPKDAPLGYLTATTHVAVVFGKHLIRDQVTVEYAKRVVTLVKQIASGALNPDVIVFTGGKGLRDDASISEAVAGYAFFRNVCEEAQIDLSNFEFILEEKSHNTKENLGNVIEELRRREGSDAVAACHFTLVSSDYHLIRIQEVHRLSPRQSVLFPLEVSAATWNCVFAAYPFCVSSHPATAFLGRAVVLANDLGIVLVNLNGAIDDRQFMSKENLHRLTETFAKMREMYRVIDARTAAAGGFRTDMRKHAETLELAIHDIREVHTLLNPLKETGASIPHAHLELARELMRETIVKMRSSMDPDRVLRVNDRMAIIDDMTNFVAEQRLKPRAGSTSGSSPRGYGYGYGYDDGLDEPDGLGDGVKAEGEVEPSPFEADDVSPRKRASSRRGRVLMSSEVTWRGGAIFKGNGKKITRDGPNLVITDSGMSMPSQPAKRARRRTVVHSDSLAGRLATAEQSQGGAARSARTTRARKQKTSTTTSVKKRKTTSRKLASPSSAGEAA